MNTIEIIGWIATIGTLLSFAVKDMYKLRLINSAASMVWILYGILKIDNPIIVINTSVILMHLYWFYKNRNPQTESNGRTKRNNQRVHGIKIGDINTMYFKRNNKKHNI